MKTFARTALLAALVAVLMLSAGCGLIAEKATEATVEKATGVDVDTKGDSVTITGEDGTQFTSDADKLPEDFPGEVPIYEDAKVFSSMSTGEEGKKAFVVAFDSADGAEAVYQWYQDELKAKGWTITFSAEQEGGGMIGATKGDLSVALGLGESSTDGMKTTFTLTVGPAQQ